MLLKLDSPAVLLSAFHEEKKTPQVVGLQRALRALSITCLVGASRTRASEDGDNELLDDDGLVATATYDAISNVRVIVCFWSTEYFEKNEGCWPHVEGALRGFKYRDWDSQDASALPKVVPVCIKPFPRKQRKGIFRSLPYFNLADWSGDDDDHEGRRQTLMTILEILKAPRAEQPAMSDSHDSRGREAPDDGQVSTPSAALPETTDRILTPEAVVKGGTEYADGPEVTIDDEMPYGERKKAELRRANAYEYLDELRVEISKAGLEFRSFLAREDRPYDPGETNGRLALLVRISGADFILHFGTGRRAKLELATTLATRSRRDALIAAGFELGGPKNLLVGPRGNKLGRYEEISVPGQEISFSFEAGATEPVVDSLRKIQSKMGAA